MINIENILYGSYIKYDRLITLNNMAFKNCKATSVNIYIDMYSIINSIYNPNIQIVDYTAIVSGIINMCAHLRRYYATRHKVDTVIYIVYNEGVSDSVRGFHPDYKSNEDQKILTNKKIYDMLHVNIDLMETLCPYLPDIFFINNKSKFEPSVIIYDLIIKNNSPNPTVIISKDKYTLQIPALLPQTIVFRPKKSRNDDGTITDTSYVIDHTNVIPMHICINSNINIYKDEKYINGYASAFKLNPNLFSIILSIAGLRGRMNSIMNIRSVVNRLYKSIEQNMMLNQYTSDLSMIYNALNIDNKFPIAENIFEHRFKAMDLSYQHLLYINTPESKNYSQIINLIDDDMVRAINDKYFKNNPLDLNEL